MGPALWEPPIRRSRAGRRPCRRILRGSVRRRRRVASAEACRGGAGGLGPGDVESPGERFGPSPLSAWRRTRTVRVPMEGNMVMSMRPFSELKPLGVRICTLVSHFFEFDNLVMEEELFVE